MTAFTGRDYFLAAQALCLLCLSTVYLFMHPTETNFVTWSTFVGTTFGVYHWILYRDQKEADAPC